MASVANTCNPNYIGDVMRYVIGHLCIDENGKYSIDIPQPDQGGGLGGLGTIRVGEGSLSDTLKVMESSIQHNEKEILARVKGMQGKKNESKT